MVNADVRIDYYEVLGVTTRAENDEVKKQYRALAKRYHPDRNPGKEDEFIGKFQAIQAAYEVLTDPAQRRKYDHDRLRFGYGRPSVSRSSSTTRQTYSQARRSAYAEPSRSHTTVRPTAAPKFSTFGKAGPDSFYDERTKAEAYPAFRNMRSPFTTPGFDSRAGRSYQPPRGSRPQSAYEAYFSKPSTDTRKTSKKKGFSPSNLQGDDEPMATSKSAYSTVNNKSTTHSFFEPVTSPTARKAVYEDARASYLNVEKNGSKYASTGGERISLGGTPGIRHTYREPSSRSRTNPPSPTSPPSIHARRRSESLDRPRRATTTASISDDEDEISFAGRNYGKSSTRRNDPFDRFSKPADTGHAPDNSGRPRRSSRVYDPPPTPKPTTPLNESVDAKPSRRPATYNASQNFSAGSFGKPSKSRSHESLNSSLPVDGGVRFGPQTKQEDGSSRGKPSARPRSASNAPVTLDIPFPPPQQTSFAAEKFSDSNWTEKLQSQWTSQNQATGKNFVRSRSPRKQTNRPGLRRMAPKPAQVSTEAEEEKNTVKSAEGKTKSSGTSTDDSQSDSDFSSDSDDPEAMDIDEVPPAKQQTPVSSAMNMASKPASKPTTRLQTAPSSNDSGAAFDLKGFDKAFDTSNKSGVGDLRDIQSALPFESQPEKIEMRRSYEEHVLSLPLPPKKIDPPFLPEESGVFQLNTDLLTKESWILYYRQMQSYHREWKKFDREMLEYIQKRQEMVDKGFVGNWMNSNSKRLNIEGYDKSGTIHNETLGEGRGGFNDYMQELVDAERVQEHWAVALERHRKCIEIFGRARNIAASRLS